MALAFVVLIVIAARQMRAPHARGWVALAVVGALGMHTVPAMLYPLGGVALWLAASWLVGDVAPPRARFLRELAICLVAAALLTTLLYAPILLENGLSFIAGNRYVAPDSREGFLFGLSRLPVWLCRDWMLGVPSWLAIVLTGAAAAGIALHRRVSGHRVPLWLAVLVWSAALLLVTRRVPGVRVWLFLVPLFALVAAAGIALSVDVVARRLRIRADGAVPVIAVALALLIGVHGVRTEAVHHPELGDISTLRDAPAIAAHLETALKAGDRVLTDIPSDAPLEYYLARRGVARSVLAWSSLRSTSTPRLDGAECLVVVVNTRGGQSLSSVLAENGVAEGDLEESGAPQRFPHGAVVHRACGRA
jgi:hypothetical protein